MKCRHKRWWFQRCPMPNSPSNIETVPVDKLADKREKSEYITEEEFFNMLLGGDIYPQDSKKPDVRDS